MYNPQLDTFIRVVEAGSFSRTTEELFVSTTAVIKQINLLEWDLDVKLFVRTRRGLARPASSAVSGRGADAVPLNIKLITIRQPEPEWAPAVLACQKTSPVARPFDKLNPQLRRGCLCYHFLRSVAFELFSTRKGLLLRMKYVHIDFEKRRASFFSHLCYNKA